MRPVLQIRLVKRPTSLISSNQLCQHSNFIRPVCHAMRLGVRLDLKSDFSPILSILRVLQQIFDFNRCFVGSLMHFRPFSVKKNQIFQIFSPISQLFQIFSPIFFFTISLILGFSSLLKPPDSPQVPHCRFFIKNKEKIRKKIGFPMPTPKNGFQILNLHLKKYI